MILPFSCIFRVLCSYQLDPVIHICAKRTEVEAAGGAGDSPPVGCLVTAYTAYPSFNWHFLCITPGVSTVMLCLWDLLPSPPGWFLTLFYCHLSPRHKKVWCAGFILHWVGELSLECHQLVHSSSIFSLGDTTDLVIV
uniref:Uncharacterized protein n=1 Tax=Rubus yellow net virus TaxID=198310 RepID=A0A7S6NGN6_9VIRU|nr:hypothetical protein [Rubus yellow net virus]